MNKYIILLLAVFSIVPVCLAEPSDEFSLKLDVTGKEYGPFKYADGAKVIIGKGEFSLLVEEKPVVEPVEVEVEAEIEEVKEADPAIEIPKRLRKMRIRRFVMTGTPIQEVVQYLAIKSRDLENGDGINFVATVPDTESANMTVTIGVRRKRMSDLVLLIAEQTGLDVRYEDNSVVFFKPVATQDVETEADTSE